jgi:N-acetylglucosaminyl-diphospho-decaprenol L-rhamnosyltransferase
MAPSFLPVSPLLAGPAHVAPPLPRRARHGEAEIEQPVEVSVCIVNWNCRDYLRACLRSLLDQPQGVSLEVIVVDNGSEDGAAEMAAREFPDVVLIRNSVNRGYAKANNQAARRARGRYLFFINNDTIIPSGTLLALSAYADAHPEVGMIGPRLRDGFGRIQVSCRRQPTLCTFLHRTSLLRWTQMLRPSYRRYRRSRRQEYGPNDTRSAGMLLGAALFLPRSVFTECGGWDEDFTFGGEDLELSVRVRRSHRVVYLPRVEITHFGRVSTRRHMEYAAAHIACGFARYLRKTGCSRLTLLCYKLIVTLDAPVQLAEKGVQYVWRRFRGKEEKAAKSLLIVEGLMHFLRKGLLPFWKV